MSERNTVKHFKWIIFLNVGKHLIMNALIRENFLNSKRSCIVEIKIYCLVLSVIGFYTSSH